MKVIFFGQATGGNAQVWFDYLNSLDPSKVTVQMLARTPSTIEASFKVFRPFGRKSVGGLLGKIIKIFQAKVILPLVLMRLKCFSEYNVLIIQGNYEPGLNLKTLRAIRYQKAILNIYGSDFIRKYLGQGFSPLEESEFRKVLHSVDEIHLNWVTTRDLFIKTFPELADKTILNPWGINWDSLGSKVIRKDMSGLNFLSARALHSYNNIPIVVEAFCKSNIETTNKLKIVGGYGDDPKEVEQVRHLVKKYKMQDRVSLITNDWFEGERLKALYAESHFNLCFGSTDQLSVSICYGYYTSSINILSPIINYEKLSDFGFKSHIIADEISVDSLCSVFSRLDHEYMQNNNTNLAHDQILVQKVFDMNRTFNNYCKVN